MAMVGGKSEYKVCAFNFIQQVIRKRKREGKAAEAEETDAFVAKIYFLFFP